MNSLDLLIQGLDPRYTKTQEPLDRYTTLRIGGKADVFFEATSTQVLIDAIKLARSQNIPVTILGGGSNILISDKGIRGLVIKNSTKGIRVTGKEVPYTGDPEKGEDIIARWQADTTKGTFKYEFKDLDYDESNIQRVEVVMESGVDLAFATHHLIGQGITGLQWYAGIPGTMGGAIHNNIHGGTHFINEVLQSVRVLNKKGEIEDISHNELCLEYDKSRFHESGEIILGATFSLFRGDADRAKMVFLEWSRRKSLQPRRSPGCAFRNISPEEMLEHHLPTTSAGYIIEHILKMTNFSIGGAMVSEAHHNFIVNTGGATAEDYIAVMREIIQRTKSMIGIQLIPEIFLIGFTSEEQEGIH